ncbi:MAG: redoxin family protein [Gemmatimonadales bacterium]|nr:redoxin family protein [Gemmatimonadales bacterium]
MLLLAGLALVAGLAVAALGVGDGGGRGPIAVPNPDVAAPVESLVGAVRHVYQADAPELLLPDTLVPAQAVQLLWFQGRPVSRLRGGGSVTLDGAGGVVRFDTRLTAHRVQLRLEGRAPISVAAAGDGGFWLVDGEGNVLRTGPGGELVHTLPAPFDYAAVVADPQGGAWLARSTELFSYRLATHSDPLLVYLDPGGERSQTMGSVLLPEHVLLVELANAGHVTAGTSAVYFAPFVRDEVIAFSRSGDTLWVAHRGLPQAVDEPRFELTDDGPTIDYAPVNLGIALGPDGRLYVLSIPGFTTMESRLDVYDTEAGRLQRTAWLPTPLPTLGLDAEGRLYLLEPFRLLTGIAPHEREAFAPFDLETLGGERTTLADFQGKVVLVNFWASWCAPCRVEMPALDSLWRSIQDSDFAFITMNEDIDVGDAGEFLDEYGFEFPVLLGRGKLRQRYHYLGLPFTVLLDRQGRVVQRWIGFAGEDQIASIRAVIRAELDRGGGMSHGGHEE